MCVLCRLQRLWEEEVAKVGLEKASLVRVIFRFQKTRLILSVIVGVLAMLAAFLGPVSFLQSLLHVIGGATFKQEVSLGSPNCMYSMNLITSLSFCLPSGCHRSSHSKLRRRPIVVLLVPWLGSVLRPVHHRVLKNLLNIAAVGAELAHSGQTEGGLLCRGLPEGHLAAGAQRHFNGGGKD